MVLKAKSENTIQPLRNVKNFSAWVLPSLDGGKAPGHKQPVEEVIEDPKITAEKLAKAQAEELKKIKEAAFKEGFDNGEKAGLAAAKKQIDEQLYALNQLILDLADPIKQCGEKTQQELMRLAFAIARQIVRRELKQDPTQLIAIIREALKLLPVNTQKIEISLHPEDAVMIKNTLVIDTESDSSRWKIKEDPVVERGSCLVSSKNSKIDASIDKQVAILFNRVAGGLRSGEKHAELQIEKNADFEPDSNTETDSADVPELKNEVEQPQKTKIDNPSLESEEKPDHPSQLIDDLNDE